MKRHKIEKLFLDELGKHSIIALACERVAVSRNTIYRWRKEDEDFRIKMDEALVDGTESISDLADSKLISAVKAGEPWAIRYWLDNHRKNYIRPRPSSWLEQLNPTRDKITGIEIKIIGPKEGNNYKNDLSIDNNKQLSSIEEVMNPPVG